MATYKVLQDIEADDKLLWMLSFRQFVYALIAVFFIYISYLLYTKHAAFLIIATLPISIFTGFLAFPFGKDQPTEVWAIAKLRFMFKPRKRYWAQSGVKELVTITVPKRIEVIRTDGLSQTEVKSRLQALANTIDSRGWAIKNVDNVYQNPLEANDDSDRLITAASPQSIPDDVPAAEDILDTSANPIAQHMDQLINQSSDNHRQQLMQTLGQIRTAPSVTTAAPTEPPANVTSTPPAPQSYVTSTPSVDESELLRELRGVNASQHTSLNNMRALKQTAAEPVVAAVPVSTSVVDENSQQPKAEDPVIMNLSNRNDLNVAVIAREANKAKEPKKPSSGDEVLVSLR